MPSVNPSREYIKGLKAKDLRRISEGICSSIMLYQIGQGTRRPSIDLLAQLRIRTRGRIQVKDFEREALERVHEQL
jgi:hypothetical protein